MRLPAPPHLVLGAYSGGLLAALAWRPPPALLIAAAALAALALAVAACAPRRRGATGERRPAAASAALALCFLAAGLAVGGARLDAVAQSDLAAYTGRHVPLAAVLTDLPQEKAGQVTLAVRVTSVDGADVNEPAHLRLRLDEGQTLGYQPTGPLTEGALLLSPSVRVEPLPPPKPGAFDYGRYLRRRGEHVLLEADITDLTIVGRRGGMHGAVDSLRRASRSHLRAGVRSPVVEVLHGMVLGDDEGVAQETIDAFRASGLLHIMAVSGENVVLLCALWSFAFALLGVHRLARTVLLLPIVAIYVLLTGADPSIVRAGIAGILGLLAILASRPSDGWLLWLAPAAALLTVNPNNLFDVSFQLSFAAVAGLLLIARPLARALSFLPGPLPEQVAVTTAASIATAPVSVLTFGSASLVSVPANVAGGFVLGPIMFLGMLSLLAGFVGEWLSAPLNIFAGLFIGFLLSVARFFAAVPGAVYTYHGVTLQLLLVLGLGAEAAAVVLLARRGGHGPLAYLRDPRRRLPLAAATAAVAVACLLAAPAPARPPDRPTLTFLDVGEGAATLVQVPAGPTVLIDAGPAPLGAALRRHAVRRLDLLVVSHGHADHIAGLEDVVGGVPIATALLPLPPEPSPALDDLARRLETAGTEVRRCTTGQVASGAAWTLHVLPTRAPEGEGGNQGENDCALVAVVELGGHRVLVPGDVEGEALQELDLPPCEVVELPHHGSRGGISAALLAALGPRLGVISVGPNSYGHPTQEALDLLADARVPLARTDQRGDVAVALGAVGLDVRVTRGW